MAGVRGIVTLTLGFVGIRMFGQGALGLVATTSVAYWFDRRRGTAVGLASAVGQAILAAAPLALGLAIAGLGWRQAWLIAAVVVGAVTLLIARAGMRDRPEDVDQRVDGLSEHAEVVLDPGWGATRGEATRTLVFWAVTGAVVTTGLIGTGLGFPPDLDPRGAGRPRPSRATSARATSAASAGSSWPRRSPGRVRTHPARGRARHHRLVHPGAAPVPAAAGGRDRPRRRRAAPRQPGSPVSTSSCTARSSAECSTMRTSRTLSSSVAVSRMVARATSVAGRSG